MPATREPLDPKVSHWTWLAWQLKYFREEHGLTLDQVGALIGTARSTTCNIEAGRGRIDERQAFILDNRYRSGFVLQLILHFARLGHDPEWFKQFSLYESEARVIKVYAGAMIPIPLQTERYMRALFAAGSVTDVDSAVVNRMARQEALLGRDDPPWFWILLDEAALMIEVGERWVMQEQLKHLLDLADRPRVSVRILPMSAGAHAGFDGPFRHISIDGRDVAYVGAQRGGRLIEGPAEARDLAVDFDRIGERAYSAAQSRDRIARQLEAFG